MPFGQVVIGPPGSGKTTYCAGVQQLLAAAADAAALAASSQQQQQQDPQQQQQRRKPAPRRPALVNLDPANDCLPYTPDIDVRELVSLDAVMEELGLGPNGGLIYAMDYLAANFDWLAERMAPLEAEGRYFMFDTPGQVELFTQASGLKTVLAALDARGCRLSAVHLVDAHLCSEPSKYLAALLLSLGAMLHLELPHVNVLSKVDLLRSYGPLDFPLDFYTEVQDPTRLADALAARGGAFGVRHRKLTAALAELVDDFGIVGFIPLAVEDKAALQAVLAAADKASGALYATLADPRVPLPPEFVYGAAHRAADDDLAAAIAEKYTGSGDGGRGGGGIANIQQQQQEEEDGSRGSDEGGG